MTINRLLTQDIIHHAWESDSEDELGNPIVVYADPVVVKGYLYKVALAHDEIVRDREVALSTWQLVLSPALEVSHRDRFEYDDRLYEVGGSIHKVWNPRTALVHHQEIQLRLVEEGTVTGS